MDDGWTIYPDSVSRCCTRLEEGRKEGRAKPDQNNHNGFDGRSRPLSLSRLPRKYLVSTHVFSQSLPNISDLCSFDCLSIMGTGGREREIRNDEGEA